ncbi:LAMI_0H07360g1_1 [Lachancea mirantina]|uniref:LAMI_0H07360g1_1 n=1 Tax=Lachancea mirantina TaxID=1230905 RepID=A0A1G4KFR1_9SACH|nr:LAMI_0H07360g1_1 [Lachancea mirantina]
MRDPQHQGLAQHTTRTPDTPHAPHKAQRLEGLGYPRYPRFNNPWNVASDAGTASGTSGAYSGPERFERKAHYTWRRGGGGPVGPADARAVSAGSAGSASSMGSTSSFTLDSPKTSAPASPSTPRQSHRRTSAISFEGSYPDFHDPSRVRAFSDRDNDRHGDGDGDGLPPESVIADTSRQIRRNSDINFQKHMMVSRICRPDKNYPVFAGFPELNDTLPTPIDLNATHSSALPHPQVCTAPRSFPSRRTSMPQLRRATLPTPIEVETDHACQNQTHGADESKLLSLKEFLSGVEPPDIEAAAGSEKRL